MAGLGLDPKWKMVAGIEPLGYRLMLAQACHGQLLSGEKVVGEK
jgi:hypothetical protein